MSYQPNHQRPQLGATFVPGGIDDYYMPVGSPELVSPAPQRIMPEVPEQMQYNIARLELDANQSPRQTNPPPVNFSHPNQYHQGQSPYHDQQSPPPSTTYPPRQASLQTTRTSPMQAPSQLSHDYRNMADIPDIPNFSAFPRLENRPPQVPPSDEEKESILDSARLHVLNSNDPEMQLAWAQDALAYVEAAMVHEERVSATQPARPVTPAVEHQLRVDAMSIVNFLADQHHPKASFLRGVWLEFGKFGLRVDKREAFRSYSRAADKGYWRAEYRIGTQFEQSNDAVKALQHYKRGSEMGDSASNYRLGMMTLLGQHSQPQDFARGLQLIRQAAADADENAPQGAYVLGMLLARELPQIQIPEVILPYNEKEARINIERAAFLGFSKAQLKMGSAYELCTLGCEFSPKLSLHYNALAARQGELEGDMAISKWFLCGYEGMFPKNEELAYVHAQRAAQGGLATAEFAMGYFNEIGMHVPVNIDKALEWYEKAANSGNKDAEGRIEGISKSRTLSKKDHEDVAINMIKSQYGSKRGQRPDRFKQKESTLPPVGENTPTDYSNNQKRFPERGSSTTPYPMTDRPPVVAPFDRPATTAPYPLADLPSAGGDRPGPGLGGHLNPDFRSQSAAPAPVKRPGSAFQVNPNIYQQSGPPPAGGRQQIPMRPNTAMDYGGGRGGRPPNDRMSNGPQFGGYGGPGPRPGGGPPGRGGPGPGPGPNQGPPKSDLPPLDIGYQAPLESKQQQRPNGNGFQRPGDRPPSARPGPAPNRSDTGHMSPHTSSGAPPPRKDSVKPPGAQTRPQPGRQQNGPQTPISGKPSPGGNPPTQAPPSKPAAPSGGGGGGAGSGKGPKTFDEMGVPKTKEQGDCILM
ncbi:HCP-like protein [Pseudovirgaria hyperparasitica]|uniref:HCP-like protein n=1 Tax=Pseudovirgaria hyperparasitica TaxID=470096 RepID=A0A6A6WI86_9PEZI|nr:HCP-like protein [Pseudovirgaria hyperparasitica]KAF2760861.1 HCP-like protein [Pseudovirgaria hyperparasitica]